MKQALLMYLKVSILNDGQYSSPKIKPYFSKKKKKKKKKKTKQNSINNHQFISSAPLAKLSIQNIISASSVLF